ncbi:unnamed protein product [Calypogeia fissa]
MEDGGQITTKNLSMLIEGSAISNEITEEDPSPPVSKAVWDAHPQQEAFDGVFKTITGHNLRGQYAQATPDRSKHFEEDDAQDIPDLEEEDLLPPKPQRLPTIKELDNSMPYPIQCTTESGIDLRPLVSALLPVSKVVEEDVLWEPHELLTKMAFTLNENKEAFGCMLKT